MVRCEENWLAQDSNSSGLRSQASALNAAGISSNTRLTFHLRFSSWCLTLTQAGVDYVHEARCHMCAIGHWPCFLRPRPALRRSRRFFRPCCAALERYRASQDFSASRRSFMDPGTRIPARWEVQLAWLILPFTIVVGSLLAYYSYRAGFAAVYFALVTFIIHDFPARTFTTPGVYFFAFPAHHRLMDASRLIPYFSVRLLVPATCGAYPGINRERNMIDGHTSGAYRSCFSTYRPRPLWWDRTGSKLWPYPWLPGHCVRRAIRDGFGCEPAQLREAVTIRQLFHVVLTKHSRRLAGYLDLPPGRQHT